jgi:hypothetical protein
VDVYGSPEVVDKLFQTGKILLRTIDFIFDRRVAFVASQQYGLDGLLHAICLYAHGILLGRDFLRYRLG